VAAPNLILDLLNSMLGVLARLLDTHDKRLTELEKQMASQQEFYNQVRDATDKLAARVEKLAAGDPRWTAVINDLNAMGAEKDNPVPDPTPDPPADAAASGGTPVATAQ
jgi:uncharacterized coiled-coil protein SlyX